MRRRSRRREHDEVLEQRRSGDEVRLPVGLDVLDGEAGQLGAASQLLGVQTQPAVDRRAVLTVVLDGGEGAADPCEGREEVRGHAGLLGDAVEHVLGGQALELSLVGERAALKGVRCLLRRLGDEGPVAAEQGGGGEGDEAGRSLHVSTIAGWGSHDGNNYWSLE